MQVSVFDWVWQALTLVLVLGLLLSAATGALLCLRPAATLNRFARYSRWIDTRAFFEQLEKPFVWEHYFYRHHRWLGLMICAGAAYVLWQWAAVYRRESLLNALGSTYSTGGLDWIVPGMEAVVVGLHLGILLLGLAVTLRPSVLKSVERWANYWVGSGHSLDFLDRREGAPDQWVSIYPRMFGLLVLLASIFSLSALAPYASGLILH